MSEQRLQGSDARSELRDALDDAILNAYCEPLYPPREEEDPKVVNAIARGAVIGSPIAMRHVARIQAAAWAAVEERIEDA